MNKQVNTQGDSMNGLKQFFAGIAFIAALGGFYLVGFIHGCANQFAGKLSTFINNTTQAANDFTEFKNEVKNIGPQIKKCKEEVMAEVKTMLKRPFGEEGQKENITP